MTDFEEHTDRVTRLAIEDVELAHLEARARPTGPGQELMARGIIEVLPGGCVELVAPAG
ncbi:MULTISPECIES: hypothetical protein [Cryobacterium]|uniref:hypothetical protein n=1 Tax=Cryobacterium TaxID=69578 RepID=UPI0013FD8264|nr:MULTISPECIES: hypothetical protein [Cryobacterium]